MCGGQCDDNVLLQGLTCAQAMLLMYMKLRTLQKQQVVTDCRVLPGRSPGGVCGALLLKSLMALS